MQRICSTSNTSTKSGNSKTISSLQVAYKKGSKETQSKCHLPLDMVNLSHAKRAQALASDLDYRKKLHDYTVLPDDIKVQQAKKAYQLQSDVRIATAMIVYGNDNTYSLLYAYWFLVLEPIPIRLKLDEGSGLGSWRLPGCWTGQKSRRTCQRG